MGLEVSVQVTVEGRGVDAEEKKVEASRKGMRRRSPRDTDAGVEKMATHTAPGATGAVQGVIKGELVPPACRANALALAPNAQVRKRDSEGVGGWGRSTVK